MMLDIDLVLRTSTVHNLRLSTRLLHTYCSVTVTNTFTITDEGGGELVGGYIG